MSPCLILWVQIWDLKMKSELIIVGVGGLGREVLDYAQDMATKEGSFEIKVAL